MGASVETTEAAPDPEEFIGILPFANGHQWFIKCRPCGIDAIGIYQSEASGRYALRRHCQTNRHIKNTTPKTQPETAQEAQEPELYEITLRGLGASQLADLCLLMAKWIVEEGKGVH